MSQISAHRWSDDDDDAADADLPGVPVVYRKGQRGDRYVNEYLVDRFIARGSWARVRKVKKADEKYKEYAAKVFLLSSLQSNRTAVYGPGGLVKTKSALSKVLDEIALHATLSHPNICRQMQVLTDTDKGYLYVILEYLDGGQIMKWDTKKMAYSVPMDNKGQDQPSTSSSIGASGALLLPQTSSDNGAGGSEEEMAAADGKKVMVYSEHAARHILVHVVCGLMYLRRVGVVHKDIKPENVILTKSIAHATDAVRELMLPSDAPPADRQDPPRPPAPISLPAPPAPAIQHDDHEEDDGSDGRSWGGDPLDDDDMMEEDDACGSSDDEMGLRGDDDDFCWDDAPIVAETEIERLGQTAPTAAATGAGAGEVRQEGGGGGGHGGGQECVSERLGGACGWMAKIVDFTTAEKMDQDGHRFYDADGTHLFGSPELFDSNKSQCGVLGPPRDVWALGCTLSCMLFARPPFWHETPLAAQFSLLQDPLVIPSKPPITNEARDLITRLLDKDPLSRIKVEDILSHEWFRPLVVALEGRQDSSSSSSISGMCTVNGNN